MLILWGSLKNLNKVEIASKIDKKGDWFLHWKLSLYWHIIILHIYMFSKKFVGKNLNEIPFNFDWIKGENNTVLPVNYRESCPFQIRSCANLAICQGIALMNWQVCLFTGIFGLGRSMIRPLLGSSRKIPFNSKQETTRGWKNTIV